MSMLQGSDDLEEAMSERLQELPPPQGRHTSPKSDAEGFSFPQDMDTDAAAPSQVACMAWHTPHGVALQPVPLGA